MATQRSIDAFYLNHGPCCAGCDHWRWVNSVAGDCTRSAPVPAEQRMSMLGISGASIKAEAGHIMTQRDHLCGDFIDSYEW
ncbi:hypothetical protein [Vreelandella titanicae]|uniref:hypothetical protein n=1 Tax=Vreelandella titanicae TaxID=664683 RepID=UPI0037F6783D